MVSIHTFFGRRFGFTQGKTSLKLTSLFRLSFVLFTGHAIGLSVSHAIALSDGGLRNVATAYTIIGPVALTVFFVQLLAKRFFSNTRILMLTSLIAMFSLGAAPFMPQGLEASCWILVGSYCIWLVTTLQFWLVSGELLSPGESRRVLPPTVCGSMGGAFAGGVLTWLLSGFITPLNLLWIWALLMAVIARECHVLLKSDYGYLPASTEFESEPRGKNHNSGAGFTASTSFLAALWFFTLLGWAALAQLDFAFFTAIHDSVAKTAAELTAVLALVHAAGALLGFFLRFYSTNFVLTYLGVGNSLLILPALTFLTLIAFTLLPISALGMLGRLFRVSLYGPLHLVATSSLYYPIPERDRARARQLADGVAVPLGVSLFGFLLLKGGVENTIYFLIIPVVWTTAVFLVKQLYVKALIQNLEDSNYYVRFAAIEGLGRSRDKRAVGSLIRALNDRNVSMRLNAAVALGQLGVPEALEPLSRTLSDSDELVRAEAARSLGKLGNPQAAKPLIDVFRRESADRVKATIIKALGTLGDMSVVGLLIEHLKHPDSRVRANAIEALAEVGGMDVGDQLLPLLEDLNNRVRANAVVALWKISHKRGILQGTECLHRMLDSEIPLMRASAAAAMGMIGDESFFSLLSKCLSDLDPQVRRNAARALENLPTIPKTTPLLKALADEDAAVTQSAIRTLSTCPGAVEPLISALSSANPKVRANAALALAIGGHHEALDSLALLLKDFNPEVRLRAVEGLSQLEDHRILAWILPLTDDDNDAVRATAVAALPRTVKTNISSVHNIPTYLIDRLDDSSWRVRANALDALDSIKQGNLPELAARIIDKEKNSRVKAIAAKILYKTGDPRGHECLTRMIESSDKWARVNAIYTMRDIGDPRLVQLLMKALSDPDPDVRRNALGALETVGGEVVESLLQVVKESGSIALLEKETDVTGTIPIPGIQAIEGAREVRRLSLRSLKDLGTIPDSDVLIEMIRDELTRARGSLDLLKSLNSLGDSESINPLMEIIKERMKNARNLALEAFGFLTGKPEDASAIARSLSGTGDISHEEVTEILASFGEKELLKELVIYLKEEWESNRTIPLADGLETLAVLLENEDQPVLRSLAASAIVDIGMLKLLAPLETALNDPSEEVRQKAREGLDKLNTTLKRLSALPERTKQCSAPLPKST